MYFFKLSDIRNHIWILSILQVLQVSSQTGVKRTGRYLCGTGERVLHLLCDVLYIATVDSRQQCNGRNNAQSYHWQLWWHKHLDTDI